MTPVSYFVPYMIILLTPGLAVDYSLIIVNRWREERERGSNNEEAIRLAISIAGGTVVLSGITVAVGLLSLLFLPVPFLRSVGVGGMLVPLVATAASWTLLPVALATCGPWLDKHRLWRTSTTFTKPLHTSFTVPDSCSGAMLGLTFHLFRRARPASSAGLEDMDSLRTHALCACHNMRCAHATYLRGLQTWRLALKVWVSLRRAHSVQVVGRLSRVSSRKPRPSHALLQLVDNQVCGMRLHHLMSHSQSLQGAQAAIGGL